MKKLYYRMIYYWHILKARELSTVISDCLDEEMKHKLEKKIGYHEENANNYMLKC
ncbi:hypothetical protein [Virgibacillus phasianinus]|uniref:hypothetical protein n=1 Tax=Virgibacillus phasianinus TaxID=2017483 RepID=UPI0012FDBB14|nr:hypothetical protein [Virgibacillus phasianinus]